MGCATSRRGVMYLHFYNLREKPFNLTPDSHFMFLSNKHQEALAHIKYGLQEKKGFLLITGEIGTGKTTLCRTILKEMDKYYRIAVVLNPMLSPLSLLKTIISDFGITSRAKTRHDMLQILNAFLLEEKNSLLVIDEAQNLSMSALEQIRLLGNLETEKEKLLQIVLVGQPELNKKLSNERLRQLNQRIAVRYHLHSLNRNETEQYIAHRLKIAGGDHIIFDETAINSVYNYSSGVPRLINIICDYGLVYGYIKESFIINQDMINEAIKEYQGTFNQNVVLV